VWIGFTIEVAQVHSKEIKFNKIVREYHRPVLRQAIRILDDLDAAKDVTQDVFLSVFRDLPNFRAESHIHTWIYRITANRCFAEHRKLMLDSISLEEAESDEPLIDEEINPEQQHIKREEDTRLDRLISQLPGKEAVVVTLCYYEGKSCKEIARLLRIPRGTVAVILHRGRLHLHKLLVDPKQKEKQR